MSSNADKAFAVLEEAKGKPEGTGEWFEVTQEQVDQFADVTHDHQFIHVDPEAAKAGPFGGTIAHGFLTLSMLTHLCITIPVDPRQYEGMLMAVNYGFDKVRFISPVPVGSRIRASSVLSDVTRRDDANVQFTRTMTVEIEGQEKPALVADWITRITYG